MSKHWNADDWHLYLSQLLDARANFPNGLNTVALKISETMDEVREDRRKYSLLESQFANCHKEIKRLRDALLTYSHMDK